MVSYILLSLLLAASIGVALARRDRRPAAPEQIEHMHNFKLSHYNGSFSVSHELTPVVGVGPDPSTAWRSFLANYQRTYK